MCQSHCNHTSTQPVSPAAQESTQEPAWVERLGGVVIPAGLTGLVVTLGVWVYQTFNGPLHFDPGTIWVLKAYAITLNLGFWTYIAAAVWYRGLRQDLSVFKKAVRWLCIDREVRSITLRLTAINDELEYAQEDYCGAAHDSGRAPELSREIVRLTEYRDALHAELDRLMAELREARPDRFN